MSAARYFYKAYSPKMLNQIYKEKIQYRASAGMDNITPKVFGAHLTENIQIISKKVLAGTYNFTRYREILISKGRGKEPRVISIPTIRDKLALAAYHTFLQNVFADTIEEPLLHTIVGSISQSREWSIISTLAGAVGLSEPVSKMPDSKDRHWASVKVPMAVKAYCFSFAWSGCVICWFHLPSSVRNKSPSVSRSNRPTGDRSGFCSSRK